MKSWLQKVLGLVLVGMATLGGSAEAQTGGPIYNGPELDYQPSPLRLPSGMARSPTWTTTSG